MTRGAKQLGEALSRRSIENNDASLPFQRNRCPSSSLLGSPDNGIYEPDRKKCSTGLTFRRANGYPRMIDAHRLLCLSRLKLPEATDVFLVEIGRAGFPQ